MPNLPLRVCLAALSAAALQPAAAASLKTIYGFPNQTPGPYSPQASLVKLGGALYGTTYWGGTANRGTVFQIDIASGKEKTLYSFAGLNGAKADGASPDAALISIGDTLYGTTALGGAQGIGTVFSINPNTGAETVLHSFSGPDGANPKAALLDVAGTLYGTASAGGTTGTGTVFKLDPTTGAETTVYSFAGGNDAATPLAGLTKLGPYLYGTTAFGGAGTLYRIDPATGAEEVLANFGGIANGGEPQASLIVLGNTLYGTSAGDGENQGNVFSYAPATNTYTQLYAFGSNNTFGDGAFPYGALVASGNTLYGTTENGGPGGVGIVFAVDATTGAETVIASFTGTNGGNPLAGMILVNGALYGTTSSAGYYNAGPMNGLPASLPGTVFKLNPTNGALATVATFNGVNPLYSNTSSLRGVNGLLAGTTAIAGPSGHSAVFTVDPTNGAEATLADLGTKDLTAAALTGSAKMLYGTTKTGGANGWGSVFSVNPATGKTSTLYSFTAGNDGEFPAAPLLQSGGALYGTATFGGPNYGGTVFKINPKTGVETTIYGFTLQNDGGVSSAGLLTAGGLLYGTTAYGGSGSANGVVFSVDPASGAETVLHSFSGGGGFTTSDGANPTSGLIDVAGTLFGTTPYGGINAPACLGYGCGVVYSINIATGTETVLHTFTGADGAYPQAVLVKKGSLLYGTATAGGSFGYGTIFTIDPATGVETTIYSFTGGDDGAMPDAGLFALSGTLYGTTSLGGVGNIGTVFSLGSDPHHE